MADPETAPKRGVNGEARVGPDGRDYPGFDLTKVCPVTSERRPARPSRRCRWRSRDAAVCPPTVMFWSTASSTKTGC